MDLIELTDKWAVQIVLCTNAETLGVDDEGLSSTKTEMVCDAVSAAQDVIFDKLGALGDEEGFFRDWNGGRFDCADKIHASFFTRTASVDEEEDEDDEYGEWEWFADLHNSADWNQDRLKQIPPDLVSRVTEAMELAAGARDAVFDEYDAQRESTPDEDDAD